MDNRRDFIKKAALLSGAAMLPASIIKAMSINPAIGSTYLDAEHIVILMQENRSFDHCFGSLQGVRGFNDPRAIKLPSGNPVWFQQNAAGQTYAPFRLDIKETKATWLGSLPHSWTNQVDARNNGNYDKWLDAKPSGYKNMEHAPLTLGYYNREDLPFYYAMADAFTVCDQNFCASLTGTTPNRLYLWTGSARAAKEKDAPAMMRNENVDYEREVNWNTFPETLEENGISWKIYQNELSIDTGFTGDEDSWLANFTDNPIEWFSQYKVRFSKTYRDNAAKRLNALPGEIQQLEKKIASLTKGTKDHTDNEKQLIRKRALLEKIKKEQLIYTDENFQKLSQKEKNLHKKAFTTNINDPDYRQLSKIDYNDGTTNRNLTVPKGDTLYQFRTDVNNGKLPEVSWLVAPENFSDHPGAPWYGSWYVSEVLDILTKDPETWKKTIFILCYDENDGYFDHVPPFVPPHPEQPGTGKISKGIDPALDYVLLEQDKKWNPTKENRESPIGLGYRVPLVIASPWSRGGNVCSELFDTTSIIQFMESFFSHKLNKKIHQDNITDWRRAICGDLTAVFSPYAGEKINFPKSLNKADFITQIHKAKFKMDPAGYKSLAQTEINSAVTTVGAMQEKGIRPAPPLMYELFADAVIRKNTLALTFVAGNTVFGTKSNGAPFTLYNKPGNIRNYTVVAGDKLTDEIILAADGNYHSEIHGPNGFYRMFKGNAAQRDMEIKCSYEFNKQTNKLSGNILLSVLNKTGKVQTIEIADNSYKAAKIIKNVPPAANGKALSIVINCTKNNNWYDFSLKLNGVSSFEYRYAGHVETGKFSTTDPFMGKVTV